MKRFQVKTELIHYIIGILFSVLFMIIPGIIWSHEDHYLTGESAKSGPEVGPEPFRYTRWDVRSFDSEYSLVNPPKMVIEGVEPGHTKTDKEIVFRAGLFPPSFQSPPLRKWLINSIKSALEVF